MLCRRLNDGIAEVVRADPDSFTGTATVPTHHPELAADELARAVTELGLGGAEIATRICPRNLGDPVLQPVFEAAQDLSAPIFGGVLDAYPDLPRARRWLLCLPRGAMEQGMAGEPGVA